MIATRRIALLFLLLVGLGALLALPRLCASEDHATPAPDMPAGPHGARLLHAGELGEDLAVEIGIFEAKGPPELRLWVFDDGDLVDTAGVEVSVELTRLGREPESMALVAAGDHWRSRDPVAEPHSFEVRVRVRARGETFEESYASHENRIELDSDTLDRIGLEIERAAPASLEDRLTLYGRIGPDEERVAHVAPRFAGVIRRLTKSVGDPVAQGELLAVIESNESLQSFEVRSPLAGVVVGRRAAVGETTRDEPLYVVADLSQVWLDLSVPRHDLPRIAAGTPIVVRADGAEIRGAIDYLSPLAMEATQSVLARGVLPNPDGRLHPGLFVDAEAIVATTEVPVAVRPSAIQTLGPWRVVFRAVGNVFEAQPVEIGRRDDTAVEIRSGLRPGDPYVAEGSFVLKSELSGSEAGHHHH